MSQSRMAVSGGSSSRHDFDIPEYDDLATVIITGVVVPYANFNSENSPIIAVLTRFQGRPRQPPRVPEHSAGPFLNIFESGAKTDAKVSYRSKNTAPSGYRLKHRPPGPLASWKPWQLASAEGSSRPPVDSRTTANGSRSRNSGTRLLVPRASGPTGRPWLWPTARL